MINKILQGDCLIKLKELPENSVDSIVTDPPYELGFMGKSWDNTGIANNPLMWKECLRVLKPGGYLLSFGGTRTYHRMACAIEDAGFEVRDMIEWVYGCLSEDSEILTKDGFKHFHKITQDDIIRVYDIQNDIYKWENPQRWSQYAVEQDTAFRIKSDTTDQIVSRNHNCLVEREGKLVFVKAEDLLQMERVPVLSGDISILQEGQGELLHQELLWQGEGLAKTILSKRIGQEASRNGIERREEPSLERGSDLQKKKGKVCRPEDKVCEMSTGVSSDGEKGRVCNGTQIESGTGDTETLNKDGVCSSYQSRCNGQRDRELNVIQDERGTQEIRTQSTYNTTLATIEKIEYTGTIFCPTVSTGAFVARRKGQVFITGNSGFPKSLNIGKAVDKLQGNEREETGDNPNDRKTRDNNLSNYGLQGGVGKGKVTKGTSEWEGWGTALKPAHEPICMARKPLSEKTVSQNVLKYGTGGINIDESRVEYQGEADKASATPQGKCTSNNSAGSAPDVDMSEVDYNGEKYWYKNEHNDLIQKWLDDEDYVWSELKENLETYNWCKVPEIDNGDRVLFDIQEGVCVRLYESKRKEFERPDQLGRFPANLIHDNSEEVRECFPESNGRYGAVNTGNVKFSPADYGTGQKDSGGTKDSGNASRFFKSIIYQAKASKSERNKGCEEMEDKERIDYGGFHSEKGLIENNRNPENRLPNKNNHPTVKPIALMEYLIKMVTPKGGIVLDPFAGSGSTLVAAKQNGFQYIGIEMTEEYIPIIEARLHGL